MGARRHAAVAAPTPALPYLRTPLRPRPAGPAPTTVRQAGGRVAATAPTPSNVGRCSAVITTLQPAEKA